MQYFIFIMDTKIELKKYLKKLERKIVYDFKYVTANAQSHQIVWGKKNYR